MSFQKSLMCEISTTIPNWGLKGVQVHFGSNCDMSFTQGYFLFCCGTVSKSVGLNLVGKHSHKTNHLILFPHIRTNSALHALT